MMLTEINTFVSIGIKYNISLDNFFSLNKITYNNIHNVIQKKLVTWIPLQGTARTRCINKVQRKECDYGWHQSEIR